MEFTRNNIDYQLKFEALTKHINRRLRDNYKIVDWAFYITDYNVDGRPEISVRIDYIGSLHSRNVFNMLDEKSIEGLTLEFDMYLDKHLFELDEMLKSKGDK